MARARILVGASLILVGCAPSFTNLIVPDGKSVVLVGFETTADYESAFLGASHSGIHEISPRLFYGEKKSDPKVSEFNEPGRDFRWVALSVDPGTYLLGWLVEYGSSKSALRPVERKTTPFNRGRERLEFNVGLNETVYIGTISSALITDSGALFGRRLIDVKKTYRMDEDLARNVVLKHNFPATEFRSVDIFADRPNSLLKLQRPWSERPPN
ncbi:MAG: hypothetical protein HOJ90_11900 [Alphaproteobacteria bacterium]|nr:hypothetical protein [Alphaproteobacteria bacterium]